jgi:hypothetical protein
MSDSGLSDIGLHFFSIGLIRYRTEGLQSDKFLSDIGLGNIDVGYRISATKIFDVAPTYAKNMLVHMCNGPTEYIYTSHLRVTI